MRTAVRYNLGLYLALGVLLIVPVVILVGYGIARLNAGAADSVSLLVIGAVALLFGILAAACLDRAFDTQGVTVVGIDGVKDRRLTEIVVPWNAIENVTILQRKRRIILHVEDAEKYLKAAPGPWRRISFALNARNQSGGKKLDIDTLQLQISTPRLIALMERHSERKFESQPA